MRTGDGPVRDEERGTRELPADGTGGSRSTGDAVEGMAGIPEQARPHPEDTSLAAGFLDDGQWDREGVAPGTPADGPTGISPARPAARARRRTTGGTMSEHERDDQQDAQSVPRATQHDAQDRSGARAMFVELRGLEDGSPEYAELRNRLVRMHLPLVEHLARRFRNRGEPLDDLTQVATIGLIKSVDRFDPDRGVEFSTYATPTVVGEIKRHFRDKGWAVRVPRRLQELRLALTTATAELSQQHGRSPTVHELAEKLAISEEEVLEGLESANAYSTLSLDVPDTDDESPAVADTLGAEDEALEGVEYRESLKPLLEDLPPREKRILLLRFFGNMTQSQIAQEVGISQMHVSRLLARTLAQLREKLLVEE
ncbi:RNA polymerase sigma factor SigF [Streptomyces sp. NPDC002766]|uniref:RNA polymerase sigma factor SigF n=1 Tax=unclassified Streptomyces TaxID=2593676 RepID=UPI00332E6CD1